MKLKNIGNLLIVYAMVCITITYGGELDSKKYNQSTDIKDDTIVHIILLITISAGLAVYFFDLH